jgi:hypothetical protein
MGAAVAKGDHPWFRAILKGETQVFGRIGDENGISSLGVLRSHVFGLVNVERGMPRVGSKELHGLVYRLFLFQAEAGIVLQKNNFKVKLKRRGFNRHGSLSFEGLKSLGRRSSGNTPAPVLVDRIFTLGPFMREFLSGQIRHVRVFSNRANRVEDDGISFNNIFKKRLGAEVERQGNPSPVVGLQDIHLSHRISPKSQVLQRNNMPILTNCQ